jgi:hypothetical protein
MNEGIPRERLAAVWRWCTLPTSVDAEMGYVEMATLLETVGGAVGGIASKRSSRVY